MGIHIITRMIALTLLVLVTIPVHIMWLRKRRLSTMPPIGSKWIYTSYLSAYRVEVVDQHPFNDEITISRVRIGDPLEIKNTLRINTKQFLSSSKPFREKK